ncbi:hypothetical protein L9F63_020494, partial [Diploptera punctata]
YDNLRGRIGTLYIGYQSMRNYEMRPVLNETENQINFHCHTLKHLYMCTINSTNNIKSIRFCATFCPTCPLVLLQLCQEYGFRKKSSG